MSLTKEITDQIERVANSVDSNHRFVSATQESLTNLVTLILEAARLDAENKALAIMEAHRASSHFQRGQGY